MTEKKIKIAIDGPAASGKSTTARNVANRLNYLYIDSGAMYRVVTLKAIQEGIPTEDYDSVAQLARDIQIEFKQNETETVVFMDHQDVSQLIRTPEVNRQISPVAANYEVRKILVKKQQQLGKEGGVVMDGRDISTVVFPDAELKVYMQASAEERMRRRVKEFAERGIKVDQTKVLQAIVERDRADQSRAHGPLKIAPDAFVIDTSELTIQEQTEKIYQLAIKIIYEK
ncbi:MAG: (d)CMP kinase [Calditrichae bacterium]|nr:(d)CMP kinase [Calditrichia bacterium]NIW80899.1 (d)CMP kinase [Calditrichia bacterium]